jgi:tRNA(adenine34) deaminase
MPLLPDSSSTHLQWMQLALSVARQALPQDVPVGAVLVKDGKLLAQAANRRERDQNPVGHAEILVLMEAAHRSGSWRLQNTVLYVTLEPCPMCASAIQQARVAHVVFGAEDPLVGACGSRYLLTGSQVEITRGILQTDCSQLLHTFFKQSR